jgi:hypothetical protein
MDYGRMNDGIDWQITDLSLAFKQALIPPTAKGPQTVKANGRSKHNGKISTGAEKGYESGIFIQAASQQ